MTRIRPFVQLAFIGVFITLMLLGKAQIWMGIIFLSVLLSTFWGRYYCGWICPINTLFRPVNWIGKKIGSQKSHVPNVFRTEKIRWIVFGFFLLGLGYTIYTISIGRKFPLPLIIIPLGLVTTLFINEKTWHRYLCPWGVLFSLSGKFAKWRLVPNICVGCSACEENCPGEAITINDSKKAEIDPTHCILCLECQGACPIDKIRYSRKNNNEEKSADISR